MPRVSPIARVFAFSIALIFSPARAGTHSKNSGQAIWQRILDTYLQTGMKDGINRVRYTAVTREDKASLEQALKLMQEEKPSGYPADARRAFWINLYNAQTVEAVLDALPLKSIRDIKVPGSKSAGPWDAKRLKVESRELSLNDIENGILRTQWKDNRIHFALNCASIGCPNLSPRAYTAANLEAQLEKGAKDYLRSPRGAAFEGGVLKLSSIFDWYKGDFGKSDAEVLAALGRFTEPEFAKRLQDYPGKIEYRYDWGLNAI